MHRRIEIPTRNEVKSLFWHGDILLDAVAGNAEYRLDGTIVGGRVNWAYRFDAAARSPSGRYSVIYERLGTKGLLIRDGKFVRELNRSFYCADAYEYPVTFASLPDGREIVIHCPDEYNRLDFEDAETGERLTGGERKLVDFFHSRLAVSPNGRWLLSAGWVWHPLDAAQCFEIQAALRDPTLLDKDAFPDLRCEVSSAAFLDNERLLLASGPEADDFQEEDDGRLKPGHLGIFKLDENRFEKIVPAEGTVGTMMPAGPDHVVSFFEHPRLIDLHSGEVLAAWDDLATGNQNSSIIWHVSLPLPALALDPQQRRFAVAGPERITVIELQI